MTLERKLIEKTYYEGYTKDREESPIEVLGQLYIAEQRKNLPDLTSIRFAQGELYFQYHDYESAIFKWDNINNELEPWAKKNLADAYMELGELSTAESIYKSISSDSELLGIEISLQLFALYIEKENHEMAIKTIKELIITHPDYSNMTSLARTYFEEQQNWEEAIELAVREGLRTESLKWYESLIKYAKLGVTSAYEPSYYLRSLENCAELDQSLFEQLAVSIWKSYENTAFYIMWMKEFNQLFEKLPTFEAAKWDEMSAVMQNAYNELISGSHPIKEIESLVPSLLTNYLAIAKNNHTLLASSAILAWNDMFPYSIDYMLAEKAEQYINGISDIHVNLEEFMTLLQSIVSWADRHDILLDKKFSKMVMEYIPSNERHIYMIGSSGSGVNAYINELVGETVVAEETSSLIAIKDQDYLEIKEFKDDKISTLNTLSDFYDELLLREENEGKPKIFELSTPSELLHRNNWSITTAPFPYHDLYADYTLLADSLLFVINERSLFQYTEYEQLLKWKEKAPYLTVQFLIYVDDAESEKVAAKRLQKATNTIQHYFPTSQIFIYSKQLDRDIQLDELSRFYEAHFASRNLIAERTGKSISIIQDLLSNLLDKRMELENSLHSTLRMYEEIVNKLTGANNQLTDIESEKASLIQKEFDAIKESTNAKIMTDIPNLLKDCKELIKEDSDFGKLHLQLNDEMNKRIDNYVQMTLMPEVYEKIMGWIEFSKTELHNSQIFLNELCEGFNAIYEENPLSLECDFTILEDWRRDARRMTSGVKMEKVNILLRLTPSQVLLKSAGKLLGNIPQNKKMLFTKYQKYIETEDFTEIASSVANIFMQQFEFYEKGLESDINIFFKDPHQVLYKTVEEKKAEIQEYKELLERLKNNPEMFHDPLRLFELRLLQYDWLTSNEKLASAGSFPSN